MAVLKNSVRNKTASFTVPNNFWVTYGVQIFNYMSDVSYDVKYDVIQGLFWAKIDDNCVRPWSGIKLKAGEKIIVLKLFSDDFAHAGVRKCAGVSEVCITYF